MRINKYVALSTGLSRRAADAAISAGRVLINGQKPSVGHSVTTDDRVTLDDRAITPDVKPTTVILNKPVGYVCSRNGQGSRTIYDLLPAELHRLKPVGRLDKDSSGLLLMTTDGDLANGLTHPSRQKIKVYEVTLDKPLQPLHQQMISDHGVILPDGASKFIVTKQDTPNSKIQNPNSDYEVRMSEGRNRQIRRTFAALGYSVRTLHRAQFGPYHLGDLRSGNYQPIEPL